MKVRFYCDGIGDIFHGPEFIAEWFVAEHQIDREPIDLDSVPYKGDTVTIGIQVFTVDERGFEIDPCGNQHKHICEVQLAYEWSQARPISLAQWIEELKTEGWAIH